ncbi:hypothetical protein [Alysiella crassa]|uniref:Uncharacterized protein n=1 Tax=Alysiella crassa TaxID=153491 RepID=A0A376BTD5_9NEIS|nr:hypothetical protein [Alysiella crassa]UOP07980.1 hypothetical protein LVJ80_06600 [Alysiella crassa]SSY80045.1 Uncharacterised protein [Alysiella crassa]
MAYRGVGSVVRGATRVQGNDISPIFLFSGCLNVYSEFNLNQYSVTSSLMYYVYTAVAVALS